MYDERFVAPMRAELVDAGCAEARTAAEVDAAVSAPGTTLVVVNSVCGCAARNARPAVRAALQHVTTPTRAVTVFAGNDVDATNRARGYFTGYRPSSPSMGLLKDGKLVFMLERHQIEGRDAAAIAQDLVGAFDRYCGTTAEP